jgi:cbb3-type cytochrome oxidase subunit 3
MTENVERAAKVRRNAWLLAGLAVFFYLGYIAWMFVRSNGG